MGRRSGNDHYDTSPDGITANGVVVEKSHMFGAGSGWVESFAVLFGNLHERQLRRHGQKAVGGNKLDAG